MSQLKRFAIVGAGVISTNHAKAIQNHPGVELVAVADEDLDKAQKLAAEYGGAASYKSYDDMFAREAIDVVSVCTPSGKHGEVTVAAARAGIHVLCEKPIEISPEKLQQAIDECDKQGVKLGCVYQRRVSATSLIVKQAIDAGKLGRLVMGDAYLKYHRTREYYESAGWRGTWALDGGGALMNQGIHGVDLIQWFMGDVESVFARTAALTHRIEVEDTAVAVLKYRNGAMGVIQGATSIYPQQETRFEVHGDKGTIIYSDSGILQWEFQDKEEPPAKEKNYIDPYHILIEDMITSIREDKDPIITGREARKAVDLILAIYESARTGREVVLQEAQR